MAKVNYKEMEKNLKSFIEITEIALNLRLSYLRKKYSLKKAKKTLFKEIRNKRKEECKLQKS